MKSKLGLVLLAVSGVLFANTARASLVTYDMNNVTFLPDIKITGSFTLSSTDIVSNINLAVQSATCCTLTFVGGPLNGTFTSGAFAVGSPNDEFSFTGRITGFPSSFIVVGLFVTDPVSSTEPNSITSGSFSMGAINETGQTFSSVTGSVDPTPLPAALPLFATGIGGLGLLGWRRKRKARAA